MMKFIRPGYEPGDLWIGKVHVPFARIVIATGAVGLFLLFTTGCGSGGGGPSPSPEPATCSLASYPRAVEVASEKGTPAYACEVMPEEWHDKLEWCASQAGLTVGMRFAMILNHGSTFGPSPKGDHAIHVGDTSGYYDDACVTRELFAIHEALHETILENGFPYRGGPTGDDKHWHEVWGLCGWDLWTSNIEDPKVPPYQCKEAE